MLLHAEKCQGYSFCRFWVIKGKPTGAVKLPPPRLGSNHIVCLRWFSTNKKQKVSFSKVYLYSMGPYKHKMAAS